MYVFPDILRTFSPPGDTPIVLTDQNSILFVNYMFIQSVEHPYIAYHSLFFSNKSLVFVKNFGDRPSEATVESPGTQNRKLSSRQNITEHFVLSL
jgi:hypothetical protein